MDTFFVTKRAIKFSIIYNLQVFHACCTYELKPKHFKVYEEISKDIGAPSVIVCDSTTEYNSKYLRTFMETLVL